MDNKKQTVLMVHNYYQLPGGEDTVVANEKKLLEDNGHKVILYTRHNNELKSLTFLHKLLLPFTTIFSVKTYRDIKKIIKENKIDIVHVHNTLNMISPSVYYAALKCKVPVVQTVHNFRLLCPAATFYRDGHICEDCLEKGLGCAVKHSCYRNSKLQTLACVISTLVHRATGIYGKINYICLTEFNKEKLLNLKQIKEEQIYIKPNFEYIELNPAQEEEIDHNKFVFVGRLDENKGIKFLLNCWKEIADKHLYIYGKGNLEAEVKQAEENNANMHYMGFQPIAAVLESLKTAEAMVFTSELYEGFPMTLIEAMAMGVPVVCADIGNHASIVKDADCGVLYINKNEDSLKNAVDKISDNNSELRAIARQTYEGKYTPQVNYKQLREIYEKCCDNN